MGSDTPLIESSLFLFSGINEQGLYRIVGVNSRVQKLLSVLMGECGGGPARQLPGVEGRASWEGIWVSQSYVRKSAAHSPVVVAMGISSKDTE